MPYEEYSSNVEIKCEDLMEERDGARWCAVLKSKIGNLEGITSEGGCGYALLSRG